jgi:predicted glycosyltransferase
MNSVEMQNEVVDLYGKFPKIDLSTNMVVGHRDKEGFQVSFTCLDRQDVIHLAAMLHFYNESLKLGTNSLRS